MGRTDGETTKPRVDPPTSWTTEARALTAENERAFLSLPNIPDLVAVTFSLPEQEVEEPLAGGGQNVTFEAQKS